MLFLGERQRQRAAAAGDRQQRRPPVREGVREKRRPPVREFGSAGIQEMVCPVCHSYCENSTTERWGVYVNNGAETFTNILPCTVRDNLRHIAGGFLNFKADGRRYVLDVYRGHKTTVMGSND